MNVYYITPAEHYDLERDDHVGISLWFSDDENDSTYEQARVFIQALERYAERNVKYKDNWKRMGWRGMLVRIRERSERMWDHLWNLKLEAIHTTSYYQDDAIDTLNFVGFLVRAMNENNRDGTWWNDSHAG